MNVFHRYTRRTLKLNPSRTVVTIVGVILSMAMFTAVAEAAYSGMQFLIRNEVAFAGRWEGYVRAEDEAAVEALRSDPDVRSSAVAYSVGWAKAGTRNGYKPYVLIKSVDAAFADMAGVRLTEGRLAENDGEIVLPEHLRQEGNGGVDFKLGDTFTFAVGTRTADGEILSETDPFSEDPAETIDASTEKTYTVVGVYKRLCLDLEPSWCPGYTALTAGDRTGAADVLLTVKHPMRFRTVFSRLSDGRQNAPHTDLLRLEGDIADAGLRNMIFGFAAALFVLIAFGSVSLIYNSFAISVAERTKQFGILKSVGATKKQIRSSVLYEALLLSAAGIPLGCLAGCGGIGVTFWLLRDSFSRMVNGDNGVEMKLIVSVPALLIAAVLCLVTVLISARIPAKRAMNRSAIEAVRSTADVKLTARDVKTGGLTAKLFGFEGLLAAKNFRRSRRRYRAVVLSLFMSVTLFITAASFCSYVRRSFTAISSSDSGADLIYSAADLTDAEAETVLRELRGLDGVSRVLTLRMDAAHVMLPVAALTPQALETIPEDDHAGDAVSAYMSLCFLDKESFDAVCRDNGLTPSDYRGENAGRGLLVNHLTDTMFTGDNTRKYMQYDLVKASALPLALSADNVLRPHPDLIVYDTEQDADGNSVYVFYPEDALNGEDGPDEARAVRMGAAEATVPVSFIAQDVAEKVPLNLSYGSAVALLPDEAFSTVVSEAPAEGYFSNRSFCIMAAEPARAAAAVKTFLSENGLPEERLLNEAEEREMLRTVVTVINVFAYGFITLISLIAAANVFNTVSTNVALRRREIAMLRSIGMSRKSFTKMMNVECLIYGFRGLAAGLPVSFLLSFVVYRLAGNSVDFPFYLPWGSVAVAVCSVFLVVFATMFYAAGRVRKENPIDALRNENL